jgi:DNA polymerase I
MVTQPKAVTVDFETMGIESRPLYPPKPVGVAIKYPNKPAQYYAFAHDTGNNCTFEDAKLALQAAFNNPEGVLFQNAKFDLDVANVHFGIHIPKWQNIHDTMYLLFLDDPHQISLGLKESAERLLGIAPDEQDQVKDWLLENYTDNGVKLSKSRASKYYYAKYIAHAPADIVGKYAIGDVDRTESIFNLLYPRIVQNGMLEAYHREIKLALVTLEMERQGLPVDLERLRNDVTTYNDIYNRLSNWICQRINPYMEINLDSGEQLMNALIMNQKVFKSRLKLTPTGKYQSTKEALLFALNDELLAACLQYRAQLGTCLATFMQPWLEVAEKSNGYIFTTWHQTKSPSGGGAVGTRTGRLSSSPNFQNIPKEFTPLFDHLAPEKGLPVAPIEGILPLPNVRSYIIPFEGHVMIDRDYSQQEPRIMAHFENGSLMAKYNAEPWVDFHDYAKAELEKMGKTYSRKAVKNTNLGLIYGMGIATLAEKNNMTDDEARDLKKAILELYPNLRGMYDEMRQRARNNQPIRTWGGRQYYCEPSKIIDGQMRSFDYKMVNILIQGSAADCTKEAIIRYHEKKHPQAKIILNVHDQITVSVPRGIAVREMEVLKECMHSVEFDVPILSEGATSFTTWANLEDYDKKGVLCLRDK